MIAVLTLGLLAPAALARDQESDTVRVTRDRDQFRAKRERTLLQRDNARDSALARQRARSESRRQADSERRSRLTAEPTNRLSDRLYFRPKPLGTSSRPR